MKRTLTIITGALAISACGITQYLWQTELTQRVYSADIHKITNDRFIVTSSTPNALTFHEMNGTGDIHPIGQTIPLAPPIGSLNLHWLDDDKFFASRTLGVLAHGSVQEGLHWRLDSAGFNSLIGQNLQIGSSYRVKASTYRSALVYGAVKPANASAQSDLVGIVAEISEQGELIGLHTDPRIVEFDVVQELNGTYIVTGYVSRQQEELLGYRGFIQQISRNGEVLNELTFRPEEKLKFAMQDRLYIAKHENNVQSISVVDWNGNQLYSFPVASRNFVVLGTIRQTGPNELFLTTSNDVEKRTLDGQLIWHRTVDRSVGIRHTYLDSGLTANPSGSGYSVYNGAALEVRKTENGDILFKGAGRMTEYNLPAYEVIDPTKGTKRTIRQRGSAAIYEVDNCSIWCSYDEIAYQAGVCSFQDFELLDDGGLITVDSYCNDQGQYERLQITRY